MQSQINNNNINNTLYVGMDLHKNNSVFCCKDYSGVIVDRRKVLTDRNDISRYVRSFQNSWSNISLVMEPVSQWYFFADLLQDMNVDVHLAHPMKVKAIASARIKTDEIDSSVLCDLLRSNMLPEAYFSPPNVRDWKEMVRYRASLVNLRTQVKNKIHSILFKHALKHEFTDLFGKSGRLWLESLTLKEPFKSNLDNYLKSIDHFTFLIKESETTIESLVSENEQTKLLVSIPGIKYISALSIMAEIGDVNRFLSSKKLMGYAGLVPSTYSSGDKVAHGRITKQGSKWLRYIMIEIAHNQLRCKRKPGFGTYYRKVQKRKGSKTAAVATARKLLAVVWRVLKDKREWQESAPAVGSQRLLTEIISS